MSNFIKFRKGECPICLGAEKRCNYLESISDTGYISRLIFCKGTTNNPNYILRGHAQQTGIGMWAYLPDTEAWKDNKKNQAYQEQYLQEKLEREKREQEQKRQKIRNSLSQEQRDKEIRKLISQLKLDESQRKQLLQRGLTAAQIEKNGYRSVNQWHKFSIPVDSRLAGVSINGNKLNNPDSGILCPVINADGLFVGLRINNENWQAKELGKYTWLSSSGRGIDNKIPVSDIDEEFPLAIHYPEQWTDFTRIGICEGLEYKSAIADNRLGYPVIGFSGNDFTNSPNLLKQAIEKIQEQILCHTKSHAKKVSPTYQSKDSSKQLSNTNLSTIYKEFVVVFKDIRALKILDDFSSFNKLDNEIRRNFKESKTYFGTEWIQDKSGTENQHLGIYIAHKDYFNP